MSAIYIWYIVTFNTFYLIRLERFGNHVRPQVRASNADIYYVFNGLARKSFQFTRMQFFRESLHLCQLCVHVFHHIVPINNNGCVTTVSQGYVKYWATFGYVDALAWIHLLLGILQFYLVCKFQQQVKRFFGDDVLGEIKKKVFEL